jgi:hypothetical protein
MSKRAQNRLINIAIVMVIVVLWWAVPVHAQHALMPNLQVQTKGAQQMGTFSLSKRHHSTNAPLRTVLQHKFIHGV